MIIFQMPGRKEYDVSLRSRIIYGLLWKENLEREKKRKSERECSWLDFVVILFIKPEKKSVKLYLEMK